MRSEEGRWLEGLDERTERERMEEATTAPERLDDAARALLEESLDGVLPGSRSAFEVAGDVVDAVERIVGQHVARAVAEARPQHRAEALRDAADDWPTVDWHANPAPWLRERADREGQQP